MKLLMSPFPDCRMGTVAAFSVQAFRDGSAGYLDHSSVGTGQVVPPLLSQAQYTFLCRGPLWLPGDRIIYLLRYRRIEYTFSE